MVVIKMYIIESEKKDVEGLTILECKVLFKDFKTKSMDFFEINNLDFCGNCLIIYDKKKLFGEDSFMCEPCINKSVETLLNIGGKNGI